MKRKRKLVVLAHVKLLKAFKALKAYFVHWNHSELYDNGQNLPSYIILVVMKWPCNFNVQIWAETPRISLYNLLFCNKYKNSDLKKLFLFIPSKFGPYPPAPPGLYSYCHAKHRFDIFLSNHPSTFALKTSNV